MAETWTRRFAPAAAAAWAGRQAARPLHEIVPEPLLSGDDLLAAGVPPGRMVGEMLRTLRTMQLDGMLSTREQAIEWVREAGFRPRA